MGKNIDLELLVLTTALLAEARIPYLGGIIAQRNDYNPAFSGKNIRKISNLKYARMPRSSIYQRRTF